MHAPRLARRLHAGGDVDRVAEDAVAGQEGTDDAAWREERGTERGQNEAGPSR